MSKSPQIKEIKLGNTLKYIKYINVVMVGNHLYLIKIMYNVMHFNKHSYFSKNSMLVKMFFMLFFIRHYLFTSYRSFLRRLSTYEIIFNQIEKLLN